MRVQCESTHEPCQLSKMEPVPTIKEDNSGT